MKKWIIRIVALVLALVTLVVGSAATLLYTPLGLSVVLSSIPSVFPALKIKEATGSLLHGVSLHGVDLQLPGVAMKAARLALELNPSCLWDMAVCIDALETDQFFLTLTETGEPAPPSAPLTEKIHLPIPIRLSHVLLNQVDLDVYGTKIKWESLSTRLQMKGSQLTIAPTQLDGFSVVLPDTAKTDAHSSTTAESPSTTDKSAPITLPNVFIPLDVEIEAFTMTEAKLALPQEQKIEHVKLAGRVGGYEVKVDDASLKAEQGEIKLNGHVFLLNGYPLALDVSTGINISPLKGHNLVVKATGDLNNLSLDAHLDGRLQAHLVGNANVLLPTFPFDLTLNSSHLQWPIQEKAEYTLSNSHVKAKGSLEGYKVFLSTSASGKNVPTVGLKTDISGDLKKVALTDLHLQTLGGDIKGKVKADWSSLVKWETQLAFDNLQPQQFKKDIQGNLSGSIKNSGHLTKKGGWAIAIPEVAVQGEAFGHKLNIEGEMSVSDVKGKGDIAFSTNALSVYHADNWVKLTGKFDHEFDMNVDIDIPNLTSSLPDAAGELKGIVKLEGSQKKPTATLNLRANDLRWQELASIKRLNVRTSVSSKEGILGSAIIEANDIVVAENKIASVSIRGSGSDKKQKIGIKVKGEPVDVNLTVNTEIEKEKITAMLHSSSVMTPIGKWTLDKNLLVTHQLQDGKTDISPFCWSLMKGKLCSDKRVMVADKGSAQFSLSQFNLTNLHALTPEAPSINALVNANVKIDWIPKGLPQIDATLMIGQGSIPKNAEFPLDFGWDSVKTHVRLNENQLNASLNVALTQNGDFSFSSVVDDVSSESRRMRSNVKITEFNLSPFSPLLGSDSQVKGKINADIAINGDVKSPLVAGKLALTDLLLKSVSIPLVVDKGGVEIAFDKKQASLNGKIVTQDGDLGLTGLANWRNGQNWFANLNVKGENLSVNVPPMVSLKVSPNMTLSATDKALKVTGRVDVPWGRILVESLPASAVKESSDLVILDDKLQPIKKVKKNPMNLLADIGVHIGDDVRLDAFGLSTLLQGTLNVQQNQNSPKVSGEINLKEGTYQSFGQNLLIKKGQILFNGLPTEPYLQVEAIRNPDSIEDNVEAGILVTGPADKPEVTIFSKPAMPQANALSYLVRGSNLSSDGDNSNMTSMLIGLGLSQSGRLVGQIGEAFGVQDLSVDTAGIGNDEKVEVSGYILPGLQVKYGVGIFTSLPEFTVRYKLMKNLYVEAVSGVDNTVDILYQFTVD